MQPNDLWIYAPSASAEHSYRRLRQANIAFYVLLGIMAIIAIWSVLTVIAMIRGGASDLADIQSIQEHISTRLMNATAIAALALFAFKEWKWGDRSFGMVFILAPFVFLWLVPVMSAEVQPAEEPMQLAFTLNHCEPGAISGTVLVDSSLCLLVNPDTVDVYMTTSDPIDGNPEWLAPDGRNSFGAEWNVDARGKFRVYFLMEQPHIDQCHARLVTSVPQRERYGHHCLEQDGKVWLVQAFESSNVENRRLNIYQEVEP